MPLSTRRTTPHAHAAIAALLLLVGIAPAAPPATRPARPTIRKPPPATCPARPAKPAPTAGHKPDSPHPTRPPTAGAAGRAAGLKSNQPSKRNNGSAKVLSGKVCLIHLFVRDDDSAWTTPQKAAERRRVSAALSFLQKQARRYGQKVSFVRETLPEAPLRKTIPVDMFHSPWWIEEAVRKAGHNSAVDLVRHFQAKHRADHAVIMLHVNKRATSYNLTYYDGINPVFHAERLVMFSRYTDGRPTCAASYAHEILHAFGAGELYFPFDRFSTRKNLARKYFPNDIMLRVAYKIDSLAIGPYTAYRIGWLDRLDAKYKRFED